MRAVDLSLLKEEITRPDQARFLEPLRRFRGGLTPQMAAARWNFVNAMFLAECQTLTEGSKMFAQGEVAHLCGNHAKALPNLSLSCFMNRLRLSPKVCAMVPGLHDYASYMTRWRIDLQVCGASSPVRVKNAKVARQLRAANPNPENAFYPFVSKTHSHDCELLSRVHALVPKGLNHKVRADLCQDLIVSVLAGECSLEELPNIVAKKRSEAMKFMPRSTDEFIYESLGTCNDNDNARPARFNHMRWEDQWKAESFVDERPWEQVVQCLRDKWGCAH